MKTNEVKKAVFLFFIILFLLTINSCSVFKHKSNINQLITPKIYDSIYDIDLVFDKLSFKALINIKSSDFSSSIYSKIDIVKDSAIFIEAKLPLGINIAEIYLSPDSNLLFFPLNNSYFFGNSSFFYDKYNVALDYFSIQSILTAHSFNYPYYLDTFDIKISSDSLLYLQKNVNNKYNSKIIDILNIFSYDSILRLRHVSIFDYILNRNLEIEYKNFTKVEDIFFPSNISIFFNNKNDSISFNLKIKNVIFDSNSNFKINIPQNAKIIN